MKKSITQILNDENKLNEYIESLEDDIENTNEVDKKLDIIINNILNKFNNFSDFRALTANKIEAVTKLLQLKSELPQKRIQTKKQILDILTKKQDLAIKNRAIEAQSNMTESSNNIIKTLLLSLDNSKIHPITLTDEKLNEQCGNVIDTTFKKEETNNIIDENAETLDSENKLNILDLQAKLESGE